MKRDTHFIFIAFIFGIIIGALPSCDPPKMRRIPACTTDDDNREAREFMKKCYEETRYNLISCRDQTLNAIGCVPVRTDNLPLEGEKK